MEKDGRMKSRLRYVVSLAGVSFALRLLFGLGVVDAMPLMSDAASYDEAAKGMLRVFPGEEAYYWPPGLPALLAGWYWVFGTGVDVARCFSVVISTTNVVLVYELARQELSNEQTARWAGWIMAFYPPSIMMTSQVVSQPVEMTALLAAILLLLFGLRRKKWGWVAGTGVAFGVGVLVRPSLLSVVFLLLILLAVRLYRKIRNRLEVAVQPIVGVGVGLLLLGGMLAPAVVHNHAHGRGWTLSTNNQYNLLLGNNPHTPLYKTNHLASRPLEELSTDARAYLRSVTEKGASGQSVLREVGAYVWKHPGTTLLRTLNRIRAFWGFDYVASRRIQIAYSLGWGPLVGLLSLEAGGYVIVMLLVLIGLVEGWSQLGWETTIIGGVVVGYQIPYWIAFSSGTYHFTLVGLLVPIAALGVRTLTDWIQGRRAFRSTAWLALLIGAFLLLQAEYAYFLYAFRPS